MPTLKKYLFSNLIFRLQEDKYSQKPRNTQKYSFQRRKTNICFPREKKQLTKKHSARNKIIFLNSHEKKNIFQVETKIE